MKNLEVPPFWPHQVEVQAVRTVTQLDLWLVRTEDGMDVYPADADTAAALEIPLKGEPDGEFKRSVAWFGRYCVPDLAWYVEWCGPYKTHDEALVWIRNTAATAMVGATRSSAGWPTG